MADVFKLIALALVALVAALAANWGHDLAYRVHGLLIMVVAAAMFVVELRRIGEPRPSVDTSQYMDDVVRAGVIATAFWGVVGFLAGTFIAFQLAFPELNFDWGQPFTNFGRLRPLHTSAVIFAFGGNALIMSSFYIVQRTCGARLWGGNLAWFVFWGYNLFIVLAATGYLLGSTQSKEYAEPEWYIDIWLTVVWVAFLAVYLGTLVKRREKHIYVANWFLLSFIVTVAMLHVVNNLSDSGQFLGIAQSVQVFCRCPRRHDAVVVRPQRRGFLPDRRVPGHDVLLRARSRLSRPVYSYKLSIIHFWALIFLYIWAGPHHLHYTASA